MVVGEVATFTDVLVIGGGPGGYAAALRAAALGLDVTLVECERLGGTCLNVGCIPSKVLIHAADTVALAGPAAAMGIDMEVRVDMSRLRAHEIEVIDSLTHGVETLLDRAGVTVIQGRARFSKPDRVAVVSGTDIRHFDFEEAIVATGSRPAHVEALPHDDDRVLSSTEALALKEIPDRLVIVGGGYIGVELGTAFAKLGSAVTLVEALPGLLPSLEARLGRAVESSLRDQGVEVLVETRAVGLDDAGVSVDTGGVPRLLPAERIIVAVGRHPNTDDLGLEAAAVELDANGLVIVEPSRRAARHVLAIGDVTPGPALAHKATAEAEVAALTAAGRPASFDPACIPQVVFSDPEVASIGLTFDAAQKSGYDPQRCRFPLAASARARILSRARGEVEIVTDREGTVLGVHMTGPCVSELAGEAALAVEMGASLEDLALTIHPHPTMSEALAESAWVGLGRGLHVASPRSRRDGDELL